MNWHDYFRYEDGNLYWKIKTNRNVVIGSMAGSIRKDGYIRLRLNKKYYYCHRVVWEMHNGQIPEGLMIDHIDGDRSNNNLENIRLVSALENQKNMKKPSSNTSGVIGVSWREDRGKWRVTISILNLVFMKITGGRFWKYQIKLRLKFSGTQRKFTRTNVVG